MSNTNLNDIYSFMPTSSQRLLKTAALFISILGLISIAAIFGPNHEITFDEIGANPQQYNGQSINFAGRITENSSASTSIIDRGFSITITNVDSTLPVGTVISGIATVATHESDVYLQVHEYHVHSGLIIKILSGPIILIPLAIWFFWGYSFDFKKMYFTERRPKNA